MSKANGRLDINALASRLGIAVITVRKWLWKLDIVPIDRVPTEFTTAKGRRVGLVSFYSEDQAAKLGKAIDKYRTKSKV
jgi:hypothetical protein